MTTKTQRALSVVIVAGLMLFSSSPGLGTQSGGAGTKAGPQRFTYAVVAEYPHDSKALTQGLVFWRDSLYESTGEYGKSGLRRTRVETGEVTQQVAVAPQYFAMGLTVVDDQLIQVTGREQKALIYGIEDLRLRREVPVRAGAWGLASVGSALALSDGTATLHFLNPRTLVEERQVVVREAQTPQRGLNELEFVDGALYANVLRTERILRINPATGDVTGVIDLKGIAPTGVGGDTDFIMNGIAYDPQRRRLFVTGKLWPKLFEIRLVPSPGR